MLDDTISFEAMTRKLKAQGLVPPAPPKRPMVLHTRVVSGAGGGPDKTILRSPHFLDRERFDMAAAYLYPQGDPGIRVIQGHAARWGCPMHLVPEAGPLDTRAVRDMLELCRKLNVTIWHAHDYKSNLLGVLLRRWWPMKLVTTVHGWTCDSPRARLYYWLDQRLLRFYEKVIVVSPSLMEPCLRHGVPMERVTYIPNAIDPADFKRQHTRTQAREILGLDPDRRILGLIGRLSPEKGIDRAIDVLVQFRRHHPTAELHVIGDGPQKAQLQQHARNMSVADAVRFHGWQADVRPWLEAMDVLLSASHQEAAANVLLEAMAMETPVAATNVGSAHEVLAKGRCGLILSDHVMAWPRQIDTLLSHVVLLGEQVQRARQRVETHYTFERRMQRVMAVYDEVLGRTGETTDHPRRNAALPMAA